MSGESGDHAIDYAVAVSVLVMRKIAPSPIHDEARGGDARSATSAALQWQHHRQGGMKAMTSKRFRIRIRLAAVFASAVSGLFSLINSTTCRVTSVALVTTEHNEATLSHAKITPGFHRGRAPLTIARSRTSGQALPDLSYRTLRACILERYELRDV